MQTVYARIRLMVVYLLLSLPFVIYGASQALKSNNNSPLDWCDSSFPAKRNYESFVREFGPGDVVVASWPGCTWKNPELDRLLSVFRNSELFRSSDGEPFFFRVISGRETLSQMVGTPLNTDEPVSTSAHAADAAADGSGPSTADPRRGQMPLATAIQRLRGTLIGPDDLTTCLVLSCSKKGLDERARVVRLIRRTIMTACAVRDEDLHLAGPVVDGLAVNEASERALNQFAGPSAVIIFIVCWLSLRSFHASLMVFAAAVFCQAATLAIVHYSGETLSALLIVLPPLIQVLAVSGGIHLMNYYFEALEHRSPTDAAIEAFHQGWLPCALSSGTTAMGTASLMVSDLTPIRLFGAYGTIGVLITAAAVLLLIPCGLIVWPVRRPARRRSEPAVGDSLHGVVAETHQSHAADVREVPRAELQKLQSELDLPGDASGGFWVGYRDFLSRHQLATLCLLFGMMLIAAKGLFYVRTSVRIETLFSGKSRILQDYEWLESKIGPLVPIEVLISLDKSCELNPRARMALIHQIDTQIRTVPEIHETTSALTFFPPMPAMKDLPERTRLAILSRAVEAAMPSFERLACVRRNASQEVWRITAHCSAVAPLDYGDLLHALDNKARNAILNAEGVAAKGVSVETSGVMPLVHEIQSELLTDLFESLVSAMIVITITMTLAQAGICNGILSMASNIFPIVLMFGAMGWIGQPMDIGSVMTASIALGIAVDDTLHYLTFFRRGLNRGMDRPQSVLFALNHCGSAMIQTSISCSLGLLAFGLSDFMPTSRFAVTMCGLLMLALWGDLMLLPALLLSPFGRMFELKRQGQAETLLNVPGLDAHMVNTTAGKI
jgi:uncharacterized protein